MCLWLLDSGQLVPGTVLVPDLGFGPAPAVVAVVVAVVAAAVVQLCQLLLGNRQVQGHHKQGQLAYLVAAASSLPAPCLLAQVASAQLACLVGVLHRASLEVRCLVGLGTLLGDQLVDQ